MLRLIFFHVPITIVTKPMHFVWNNTGVRFASLIPEKMRVPLGAALTVAVIIIGSFASKESQDNTRANRAVSLFGLVVFLGGFYITSRNRKKIVWHTVIVGMLVQFIIALFVLRTKAGYDIFTFISGLAGDLLSFAHRGVAFLTTEQIASNKYFFFSVIPAIIFFVAFVQVSIPDAYGFGSESDICSSCITGVSCNGSSESSPSFSSGPCESVVPRPLSLLLLLSSDRENQPC